MIVMYVNLALTCAPPQTKDNVAWHVLGATYDRGQQCVNLILCIYSFE